jgi:hypothetical protein
MPIELRDLSKQETLYLTTLMDDFYGELNCMAGMPERRHPARCHLLGEATLNLQANVALMDNHATEVDEAVETSPLLSTQEPSIKLPYAESIQRDNLQSAMLTFLSFCRKITFSFEPLSTEQIQALALAGVDRLLEYLTYPKAEEKLTEWKTEAYLQGLIAGDGRRWILSLSESALKNVLSPLTLADFYTVLPEHQAILDTALEERGEISTLDSAGYYALIFDSEANCPRETSEDLHESVKTFHAKFQTYVRQPFLDEPEKTAVNALRASLHRMDSRSFSFTPTPLDFDFKDSGKGLKRSDAKIVGEGEDLDVTEKLNHFFKNPSELPFFNRFFEKPQQYWLMRGDLALSEPVLFQTLRHYLHKEDAGYVPLRISLRQIDSLDIDFNAPFLPQYFQKGLGYSAPGLLHLKNNYPFLFFFEGLDTLLSLDVDGHAYRTLMERLYFGEETADWKNARIVFTASMNFIPPSRPHAIPVQETVLSDVRMGDSLRQWFESPWVYALSEGLDETEEQKHYAVAEFFTAHEMEILPLVESYSPKDNLRMATENEQLYAMYRTKVSPAFMNLITDLIPFLSTLPKERWPDNRLALYEYALSCYLMDNQKNALEQITRIAFLLFQKNTLAMNVIADGALMNLPFLSGSLVEEQGVMYYRYAFTQIEFRDYLIATCLWKQLMVREPSPLVHGWNRWNLTQRFPGVLDFLGDFLRQSETELNEAVFLYQRWGANGEQIDWENAYSNARALLARSTFTEERLIDESQRRQQRGDASSFLRTTAHWEMRLIARLKKTHAQIQRAAFGSLGNGCGISAISARYENQEAFADDRRYIFANSMDKKIGEQLIHMARHAIDKGADSDVKLLCDLVPGNWGFHRRDALLHASKNFDVMDVIVAEKAYLTLLEQAVFLPQKEKIVTQKEALGRLKRFQAGAKAWLEENLRAYREKSIQDGSWYDAQELYCQATEKNLDKRVARYHEALKKSLELRVNWLKNHIKEGQYKALGELCQAEQDTLSDGIENAQANIETMMKRSLSLMSEIKQRFGILMSLTPKTKAIYEAYTEADKSAVDEEIKEDNDALAKRFITGYLQERYGDIKRLLEENIKQERVRCFTHWIETFENQDPQWAMPWDAMRQAWKDAEPEDKDLFINAIKRNRLPAIKALFSTIFTEHATLAQPFVEMLEASESLIFNASVERYIEEQSDETKNAWQHLPLDEKERIFLAFKEGLERVDALKRIIETHADIFPQPSIEYIMRYLRFGLSVDACCDNTQHQTLLFYALKRLGDFPETHPLPQTDNFYQMIRHLVNTGATVLVQSDEVTLNTPKNYVEHKCNLYPENERWTKLAEVLDTVILWFELQKQSEERLNHLVNQLLEHVEYYDGHILNLSNIASFEDLLNTAGKAMRSQPTVNSRRESMDLVKETAKNLLSDRFNLKDNLEKLKDKARNGERRLRMGRLNEGIYNRVDACIKNFEQSIASEETLARYHMSASKVTKSSSVGAQIARFFGRGERAPDSAEVKKLKARVKLSQVIDTEKDAVITEKDATIVALGSVVDQKDAALSEKDAALLAERARRLQLERLIRGVDSTDEAKSALPRSASVSPDFFNKAQQRAPEAKGSSECKDGHNPENRL